MTIRLAAAGLALALALAPGDAGAFSGGGDRPAAKPGAADYAAGKKASAAGDYKTAITFLAKAAAADPNSADGHNLLGYSFRKLGDVEKAFEHYRTALRIEPKHRGANEYIGELYLDIGDLTKAEEHLKILKKACQWGCAARSELKEAIKAYKASHGG